MRCLLPFLLSALVAAEPVPFLDLSLRDAPSPPEPVAAWWREACVGAGGWLQDSGSDLPAAIAAVRVLRLSAGGATTATARGLVPVLAGWVEPASAWEPLRPIAGPFPSVVVDTAASRAAAGQPGWAADADEPPAGVRVVLHGAVFDAEAAALLGAEGRSALAALHPVARAAVRAWRMVAAVEPDGRGWVDLGLPERWLAPVDPAVGCVLPGDAALAVALAPDWPALVADLSRLDPGWAARAVPPGILRTLGPGGPAALGRGTWAVAFTPVGSGGRLLLAVQRTPEIDRLVPVWAAAMRWPLPSADGQVVDLPRRKGTFARNAGWWLVGSERAMVDAALAARSPALSATVAGLGWAVVRDHRPFLAGPWSNDLQMLIAALPLPERLVGVPPWTEQVCRDQGWRAPGWDRRDFTAGLAGLPASTITLADQDGQVRADLGRGLPAWIIPGAALRWFAAAAQDAIARDRWARRSDHLRSAGIPVDLRDLAGRPASAGAGVHPALAALAQADTPRIATLAERWAQEPLPLAASSDDDDPLVLARLIAAQAGDLPSVDHRQAVIAAAVERLRERSATRSLATSAYDPRHLAAAKSLAVASVVLASTGDPAAVGLAERAKALAAGAPLGFTDLLMSQSIDGMVDQTMVLAGLTGALGPAGLERWLVIPVPDVRTALDQAGDGERILIGHEMAAGMWPPVTSLLMPVDIRAWTGEDAAALARWYGTPGQPRPEDWVPRSRLTVIRMVPLDIVAEAAHRHAARHHLVRLAWRLYAAAPGRPPADAAAASALLGSPLVVPWPGGDLPLTYERRGTQGFRLAVVAAPMPDHIAEPRWMRMTARAPDEARLVLPGSALEIVITP